MVSHFDMNKKMFLTFPTPASPTSASLISFLEFHTSSEGAMIQESRTRVERESEILCGRMALAHSSGSGCELKRMELRWATGCFKYSSPELCMGCQWASGGQRKGGSGGEWRVRPRHAIIFGLLDCTFSRLLFQFFLLRDYLLQLWHYEGNI